MRAAPLIVLMFHGVVKDLPDSVVFPGSRTCLIRERDFEACVAWCARTHRIVTLADVDRYRRGEATEPGVLITFDDGLASVTDLAVPILARFQATAVLFVTTGWVDGKQTPPVFCLERDLWERPPIQVTLKVGAAELSVPVGSQKGAGAAIAAVWTWCFAQGIAPLRLQPEHVAFDGRPWEPDPGRQDRHVWFPATWEELANGVNAGVLEIAAHGATHTPWPWLSPAEQRVEMGDVRARLEDIFRTDVRACSYPHGMYSAAAQAAAAVHYDWAFTNVGRPVGAGSPHELPRYHVPSERPVSMDAIVRWPTIGRILRRGASVVGWN